MYNKYQNTLIAAAIIGLAGILWAKFKPEIVFHWLYVVVAIVLIGIYFFLAYEKTMNQLKISDKSLKDEWDNLLSNKQLVNGQTVISTSMMCEKEKSMYLSLGHAPVISKYKIPDKNYVIEFKAKIIHNAFAWCVDIDSNNNILTGYMFQYDRNRKNIRPHMFIYNSVDKKVDFITPEMDGTPVSAVEGVQLVDRTGWFNIRTEVTSFLLNGVECLEVQILDMNNNANEVCDFIYPNGLLSKKQGNQFGFRNYGYDSSLYKDISIKKYYKSWFE